MTHIRPGVDRAAGYYEQCIEPSARGHGVGHVLARAVGSLAGLRVGGLTEREGRLSLGDLRRLAGGDLLSSFDDHRVDLLDLFLYLRVSATCEDVVIELLDGEQVALSADVLVRSDSGHLTLGRQTVSGGIDWHAPIAFHSPLLPGGRPAEIAGLDFVMSPTFSSREDCIGRRSDLTGNPPNGDPAPKAVE